MPITNLSIQRKRLNELVDFKKKFIKDVEEIRITKPDNYQYFYIIANNFDPDHIDYLKQMRFDVSRMEGENGKIKVLVGKMAPEKRTFPYGFVTQVIDYAEQGYYLK